MESNDKVIVTPMSKNFFLNETRMISLNSTLNQLVQGKSKVLTPSKTNIQKNSCKIENLYRKIQFFNNSNILKSSNHTPKSASGNENSTFRAPYKASLAPSTQRSIVNYSKWEIHQALLHPKSKSIREKRKTIIKSLKSL